MERLSRIFRQAKSREETLAGIYLIPKLLELNKENLKGLVEILPWEILKGLDNDILLEIFSTFQGYQVFCKEILELKIRKFSARFKIVEDLQHFSTAKIVFDFGDLGFTVFETLLSDLDREPQDTVLIITELFNHGMKIPLNLLCNYLDKIFQILSVKGLQDHVKESIFFLTSNLIKIHGSTFIIQGTMLASWEKRIYFLIQMAAIDLNWCIDSKDLKKIPLLSILLGQLLEILVSQIDNIHDIETIMQLKEFTGMFFIQLLEKVCDLYHSKELVVEYYAECMDLICFWIEEQDVDDQMVEFKVVLDWFAESQSL